MENASYSKPSSWYWIVSGLAFAWMLFGVFAWFMDLMMDESMTAQMSVSQRTLYEMRPQWIFVIYAIAIFSGLAGAVGLLLRKLWTITAFGISLVMVILQFGYTFIAMDAIRLLGAATALPFPVLILAIGAFLLWFSLYSRKRGWMTSGQ